MSGVPSPTYKKGAPAVELNTFNKATPGAVVPMPTLPSANIVIRVALFVEMFNGILPVENK